MRLVMRQNQNTLSDDDKLAFASAVRALKDSDYGYYDELFVKVHRDTVDAATGREDAHKGPAFFPWHREFLRRFEGALQYAARRIDPPIPDSDLLGLPYWDWSVDSSPNSSIWGSSGFLGGNGDPVNNYRVPSGPFAFKSGWTLTYTIPSEEPTNYLRRRFGPGPGNPGTSLPTPQDVTDTLNETAYDVYPWNSTSASGFRNRAEGWSPYGMHNLIHMWVGGSMVPITSPNDPVFFLHHCFIDKLWADWQRLHQNDAGYQPYLPNGGARQGHNLNDPMRPWNQADDTVRPSDMLSHRALGYRYDTENYLLAGEELFPAQWIWSPTRKYLLWPDEGQLFLTRSGTTGSIWNSGKPNPPRRTANCVMENNGNLVLYDPNGGVIWRSGNQNIPGSYLWVSDDGYVELYAPGASDPFWWKPDS
jgi:tyrosinase